MLGLLMMYGGGGVVCFSLCRSLSNVRWYGCRATFLSGAYGWYLVRLTYLGGFGWKQVVLCISIFSGFFKCEIIGLVNSGVIVGQ